MNLRELLYSMNNYKSSQVNDAIIFDIKSKSDIPLKEKTLVLMEIKKHSSLYLKPDVKNYI